MIQYNIIRERARKSLKQNFLPIAITMFLVGLIPFIAEVVSSFVLEPLNNEIDLLLQVLAKDSITTSHIIEILSNLISANCAHFLITALFSLANIFTLCFELSLAAMFLITAQEQKYEIKDFKDAFSKIKASFCLNLLMSVKIFLWGFLFVIPGIIKALSYVLANHIRLEEPELSANECLKKSESLMKGRKCQYVGLLLSFLGWIMVYGAISGFIIVLFTSYTSIEGAVGIIFSIIAEIILYIAMIPLEAYIGVADAHYYLEIVREEEEKKFQNYTYDNTAYREYVESLKKENQDKSMFDVLDGRDDFYRERRHAFGEEENKEDKPFSEF